MHALVVDILVSCSRYRLKVLWIVTGKLENNQLMRLHIRDEQFLSPNNFENGKRHWMLRASINLP